MKAISRVFISLTIACALLGVLPVIHSSPAHAAPPPAPIITGWLPYWTTTSSLSSFSANADLFTDVSPFWHDTTQGPYPGTVTIINHNIGVSKSSAMSQLRASGKRIVPSITDGTSKGWMASVLANPSTRSAHVQQLLDLAISNGYDGIDLDYEKFAFTDGRASWPSTQPNWAAFVTELAARFHERGLVVTAAVPTSAYTVYDFPTLGRVLDGVRVMTYDYSYGAPGPVSPLWWFRSETSKMLTMIPGHKLMMGVPTYGRDWVRGIDGVCPAGANVKSRTWDSKMNSVVLGKPGATAYRDSNADEVRVLYADVFSDGSTQCMVHREAWLSDQTSAVNRVQSALDLGAAGAALWTVGGEEPAQWPRLREIATAYSVRAIDARWRDLGGDWGVLGSPTSDAQAGPLPGSVMRTYQRGAIYWSPATGAQEVYGEILARYRALSPGEVAGIGLPTSGEKNGPLAGSRMNSFQRGGIYWSPATGAHEVYGAIAGRYASLSATNLAGIGLPTSGEKDGPLAGSRMSTFQRGGIYWSATTGAHDVYGEIHRRYATLSATNLAGIGLPTSGEKDGPLAGSRMNSFQRGGIYWSATTGAHDVYGAIAGRYMTLSPTNLAGIGLPTSGEKDGPFAGSRMNSFQRGGIYWSAATGAHDVYGAIHSYYTNLPNATRTALGLPTSGEQPSPTGRMNNFQHGTINWNQTTGRTTHTLN